MTFPGDCLICRKHAGSGPLIGPLLYEDELVLVTHRPPDASKLAVPGYLFVESRRHAESYTDLSADEVQQVATISHRSARALKAELAPEAVFSFIAGRSVSHFHQHVFARPIDTPRGIPWHDVDTWTGRPRVTLAELDELSERLRFRLAGSSSKP